MIYNFKEEDAYEFARFVGSPVKRHGDELRFTQYCPYCHGGTGSKRDKDTFSINLRTGQFKCLRSSCGITGNMITGIEAEISKQDKTRQRRRLQRL